MVLILCVLELLLVFNDFEHFLTHVCSIWFLESTKEKNSQENDYLIFGCLIKKYQRKSHINIYIFKFFIVILRS